MSQDHPGVAGEKTQRRFPRIKVLFVLISVFLLVYSGAYVVARTTKTLVRHSGMPCSVGGHSIQQGERRSLGLLAEAAFTPLRRIEALIWNGLHSLE